MRMARPGSSGIRGKFGPFTLYFLLLSLTDPDQTFKPNLAGQKQLFQHILEKERAAVTPCVFGTPSTILAETSRSTSNSNG